MFHPRLVGGSRDSIFWLKYLTPLLSGDGQGCIHFDGSKSWHGEAIQYIEAAVIAKAAAISESECLRCFRCIVGLTPIQYVIQYRIQKAEELLISAPELNIAEVGARCGFQDASYFAKTFHALKECTPSGYHKQG